MVFAPRKPSGANTLPRRTSSLRTSIASSTRSRTPSASCIPPLKTEEIDLLVKTGQDKEPSNLDVIAESGPKKGAVHSSLKPGGSPPTATRKKSTVSLLGKTSTEALPATTAPQQPDVSASTHPSIRELRGRPRPISISGIPSPSPTRANSEHVRKDKYGALISGSHRRAESIRSVSTNVESKLGQEKKPQVSNSQPIVPPREASKSVIQNRIRAAKAVQPPPHAPTVSKDSSRPPTRTAHGRQLSKDLNPASRSQLNPKPSQKALRPQPSKDLSSPASSRQNTLKTASVRKQPSKDLSPTPSVQSSPNPKAKSTYSVIPDSPPEQVRLLQLLHLIPLSQSNLALYESSAHQTLSARYNALQTRFQKTQKHDHAQYLADTLVILKSWSDAHIRTLSTLLIDWESLSADFRAFCKRLHTTLKPINKSTLEEKDRLFSRLHDLEVVLVGLPSTGGPPGKAVEEIRENLPLLRREVELAITVAGLRWKREVLEVERKRMEVVQRMSLGKPGKDGAVCAWRE